MIDADYWFSRETCFSCGGKLVREKRKGVEVLRCKKCGVVNAAIED